MADEFDEMADEEGGQEWAGVPQSLKQLRACLRCSLIKEFRQFYEDGCENCPSLYAPGEDNHQMVTDCTTHYFDGSIAMIDPQASWVARWQGTNRLKPGLYAVSVTGDLPAEVVADLENQNAAVYVRRKDP